MTNINIVIIIFNFIYEWAAKNMVGIATLIKLKLASSARMIAYILLLFRNDLRKQLVS